MGGPVLRPSGGATVVGLLGDPVAHSLSPAMHNSAFRALGMDWIYAPFPVVGERLAEAVAGVRALGMRGVNVTIPHKETVVPLLDECTADAAAAGAVNTVVSEGGRLVGDNTDGVGFVRGLREECGFEPRGAKVVVYGAGGAARAIAVALARAGAARLLVVNRTVERARRLAADAARWGPDAAACGWDEPSLERRLRAADLLVQTTPAGMAAATKRATSPEAPGGAAGGDGEGAPLPPPLQREWLHPRLVVADIVYTPLETPLVRGARAAGCTVAPGWAMLLYQGAEAFTRWTGRAAPVDVMRGALLQALGQPGP